MNALSNEAKWSQTMPATGGDSNSPTSNHRGKGNKESQQTNFRHCAPQDTEWHGFRFEPTETRFQTRDSEKHSLLFRTRWENDVFYTIDTLQGLRDCPYLRKIRDNCMKKGIPLLTMMTNEPMTTQVLTLKEYIKHRFLCCFECIYFSC